MTNIIHPYNQQEEYTFNNLSGTLLCDCSYCGKMASFCESLCEQFIQVKITPISLVLQFNIREHVSSIIPDGNMCSNKKRST